jgi:predicted metalloprotease with PDZ domain
MHVRYRVSLECRREHRLSVQVELPAGVVEVGFPSWAPGSYLMREFGRFVRDVHAHHMGAPVAVDRRSRNRWAVCGPATLEYSIYAHEKSVRTAWVGDDLAFFLPSNVLVFAPGQSSAELTVDVPEGHTACCPAGPVRAVSGAATATFTAPDLDTLMDSPVAIGPFEAGHFVVDGVPHEHWIEPGHNGDMARMATDLARIVTAAQALVGGPLPYPHYQFVTLHARGGHGGLEHKNGSVLLRPRLGFADARGYEEFLTLAAHEHFHAWNVKRIHPEALGPRFDYLQEAYTPDLWWLEGGTVYYEERIAYLSGVVNEKRHLERLADLVTRLRQQPGRRHQSLEESSFDAWIKLYRPTEDTVNSHISYYLKGAVVVMCLDLELRHRSGGKVGVDDVLRALWEGWGRHGVAYPPGTLERLATELAGGDGEFRRWFAAHVRGTDEVDVEGAFDRVGLRLVAGPDRPGAALGVELAGLAVKAVREDGPSRGQLSPGDELLAIDGERLDPGELAARLRDLAPGRAVDVLLSRDGRVLTRRVRLAAAQPGDLMIERQYATQSERSALLAGWLSVRS